MTKIYSIYDTKTKVYNVPWYQRTHGEAERFVKSILSENPKELPGYYSNIAKYPEDFDLFHLGEFDESEGKMILLDSPHHIVKCKQLTQSSQS